MAARSDQVHSHQFTLQRVTAALAVGDPDPTASPVRRSAGAIFAGVMLAVVALAAVAAYGVLRPGDDGSWRDGGAVIVEKETGARFVYRDGVLHPTLNYASALLILGSAQPSTAIVSRAVLAGVPRGAPLGIAGAPDPLPGPSDLLTGAWTLCSRAGSSTVESLLVVGGAPSAARTGLGDRGLLVLDQASGEHLLWHGRSFPLPGLALTALGWRAQTPTPVAIGLLNAVPAGPAVTAPRIDGRGAPSAVAGRRVGEVVVVASESGARQYAVVQSTGLAAITQLQADLLLADPSGPGGPARPMTSAEYAAAPVAASLVPVGAAAPPVSAPALARPDLAGGVCASFVDGATPPVLSLTAERPTASGEVRADRGGVDRVAVPPGHGAVVTAPGSGTLGVVSDLGVLFPVPSAQVLATLGYAGVVPRPVPAALLALVPTGSALDPAVLALSD